MLSLAVFGGSSNGRTTAFEAVYLGSIPSPPVRKFMKIDKETLDKIAKLPSRKIIGVSGFGGSGKSSLAREIGQVLDASVIGVDSFQKNRIDNEYSLWGIMDYSRLEREVLIPFLSGATTIQYGHFDWVENNIEEMREVSNADTLIIEGVGLFRPELMKYFSYTIWVDCPLEESIARGKKRDREEHHNPQDELWDAIWRKNDTQYYETYKPQEVADSVVSNT